MQRVESTPNKSKRIYRSLGWRLDQWCFWLFWFSSSYVGRYIHNPYIRDYEIYVGFKRTKWFTTTILYFFLNKWVMSVLQPMALFYQSFSLYARLLNDEPLYLAYFFLLFSNNHFVPRCDNLHTFSNTLSILCYSLSQLFSIFPFSPWLFFHALFCIVRPCYNFSCHMHRATKISAACKSTR